MAVNSNVGFKLGTQDAVDSIIKNKTSVTIGSFYLTSDTHRLYIGESDGLHPVNEGVITVEKIENLPDVSGNEDAYAGRFYYVKEGNILCVFNGQVWAQINSDTYVKKHDFTAIQVQGTNIVKVNNTIYNYTAGTQSSTALSKFEMETQNGITASVTKAKETIAGEEQEIYRIILKGDTYTIGTEQNGANAKVTLTSKDAPQNNSQLEFIPGIYETEEDTNVTLTVDKENKTINFAVKDTKNKTLETLNIGDSNKGAKQETTGFQVSLTDSFNKVLRTVIDPQVTFGVDKTEAVKFKDGNVTLDVYSKTEIQDKLKALNAMTYRGTLGTNADGTSGSAGKTIRKNANGTYDILDADGKEIKVSIGDTFMIVGEDSVTLNGSTYLSPCTLLVARPQGNTENDDGYLDDVVFDVIEATVDVDTTYRFEGVSSTDAGNNGGGINLVNDNGAIEGKFIVHGGTQANGVQMLVARETVKLNQSNGYKETLTVTHGAVTRTDKNNIDDDGKARGVVEMEPQEGNFGQQVTIPAVIGVTTDSTGHITGIRTQDYVIEDTNAKMGKNTYVSEISKQGVNNVGILKSTVAVKSHLGAENKLEGAIAINSESLTISQHDTSTTTLNDTANTAVAGLKIEMLWGEFK
jgi:hypothetical protein